MSDCQTCGACCVFFEQIDLWTTDDNFEWLRERDLIEKQNGYWMMKQVDGRCIALVGEVGEQVSCSIYKNRPEGCEVFEAGGPRCRTAIFVEITRAGKPLFVINDPASWPKAA